MKNSQAHHEESDVDVGGVFRVGAWLLGSTMAAAAIVWLLFGYFDRRERETGAARSFPLAAERAQVPPQPRLQVDPRQDLREHRRREDELLNAYRWVDREAGIVRIPIAEAMRLTLERGLPVRDISAARTPAGGAR